jgi:hypothetical protein
MKINIHIYRPRHTFIMLGRPLFSAAMEHHHQRGARELQLPTTTPPRDAAAPRSVAASPSDHPHLDLSLSISTGPPPEPVVGDQNTKAADDVQALKRQTAEQARTASAERAYAERVTELARRELELAEREFARAWAIWERARGEVEKVECMKAAAARRIAVVGPAAAFEITCHACMHRFQRC